MQTVKSKKKKDITLKRQSQCSIRFNSRELNAINHYCEKFRVGNKAKFMREAIIMQVLKKFDDNYPTLWDDPQIKLF